MLPDDKRLSLSWVGDRYLRLSLGDDTSLWTHGRVRAACERLRRARIAGLCDMTPAYATLLLSFDLTTLIAADAEARVLEALGNVAAEVEEASARLVEIPVCYEGECAPDLDDVARLHGLTAREAVALHAGAEYVVRFIGFSPGFPYLGGLPTQLATPRLDRPRARVPAGSVGIAGEQTGIYPQVTPGGWRLIGRTPLALFDARRNPPSLLAMEDRVRFVPISLERFRAWHSGSARLWG